MGAYRGNADKVMKDARKIARRLRETNATFAGLRKEYHCSYPIMMRAVLSQMSKEEWKQIRRKILARSGVKTRFQKGLVTWNKGLHYNPGGQSVATRFKAGHLPHNGKKLGTITIRKDNSGQLRMIALPGPTAARHRWVPYALYIWEQEHGPVPKGCLVAHEDGNRLNDDPNNLVLVDRRGNLALMRKNCPGWKKKAIRSRVKTCRIKRVKKAKTAKETAKIREHELKLQQRATAKAAKEAAKIREQELKLQQKAKAKAVKEAARIRELELKRQQRAQQRAKAKAAKEAAKIREQELKRQQRAQQRAKAKAAKEAAKIREQELKRQQRVQAKAAKEAAKIREQELKRQPKAKAEVTYELMLQRKARRQAERDARAKTLAESYIVVAWWECIGCGFDFTEEPPWKCPKCEGLWFSKITQRKYAKIG